MKMYGKESSEYIYGLSGSDEVTDGLCRLLFERGAAFVGFSDISRVRENHGYKACVTVGFRLFDGIMRDIKKGPTFEYFHHYRTVNYALDQMTLAGATYLNRSGFDSLAIPASQSSDSDPFRGAFSHKTGARLSGAGFIGKNALFISRDFGSKVRLASILTAKDFDFSGELCAENCGGCTVCTKACPAGAIYGVNYAEGIDVKDMVDVGKCSAHMKSAYKDIGRGAVCGICIGICPRNGL